jgi:hypothetical protein
VKKSRYTEEQIAFALRQAGAMPRQGEEGFDKKDRLGGEG